MEVIPIALLEELDSAVVAEIVDRAILSLGLEMAMRTTLKAYPASIHWHVRRPKRTGTLEITYDPATHHAWFSTRAGRTKEWVMEAMEKLVIEINTLRSPH